MFLETLKPMFSILLLEFFILEIFHSTKMGIMLSQKMMDVICVLTFRNRQSIVLIKFGASGNFGMIVVVL